MPIHTRWFNDDRTILLETFQGSWSVADYQAMVDQAAAMLATVPHTVHIIVDATTSGRVPVNIISGITYAMKRVPANQGITVFVHVDVFINALIGLATRLNPRLGATLFSADTLDDALALIVQRTEA